MKIGDTTESAVRSKTESSQFGDMIQASKLVLEEPHRFRFLDVPTRVRRVFYPTVGQDEVGNPTASWKLLNLPEDKTVFDFIASVDRKVKIKNSPGVDPKRIRSNIEPRAVWITPVLERKSGVEPKIYLFIMGWQIAKHVIELQRQKDTERTNRLRHGLLPMFDVVVTAHSDDKKKAASEWMRRFYTVEAFPRNKFSGKVPASWLDKGFPEDFEFVEKGVFTAEEMQLIEGSQISMEEVTKELTNDEIKDVLEDFPLNIAALDNRQDPFFANPKLIVKELQKLSLESWVEFESGGDNDAASENKAKHKEDKVSTKKKKVEEEDDEEEAEIDDLDDDESEDDSDDDDSEDASDDDEEEEDEAEEMTSKKKKSKKKDDSKKEESDDDDLDDSEDDDSDDEEESEDDSDVDEDEEPETRKVPKVSKMKEKQKADKEVQKTATSGKKTSSTKSKDKTPPTDKTKKKSGTEKGKQRKKW